jgi:hypothetical protein
MTNHLTHPNEAHRPLGLAAIAGRSAGQDLTSVADHRAGAGPATSVVVTDEPTRTTTSRQGRPGQ